jgi:hypothetical protein
MSEDLSRNEILSPGPDDGDWTDVLRRARWADRRRRVYEIVALTALIAIGVASAYAMGHPVIDFNKAEKAPNTVVTDFGELEVSAPENMMPGLLPHQAREIPGLYFEGKPYKFYVAPTKSGGFCSTIGGCVRVNDRRVFTSGIGWSIRSGRKGVEQIDGVFFDESADRLVLSYADSTSVEVPFVWVATPIDAGFFVFSPANRPTKLTLYDTQGKVIARESIREIALPEMGDRSLPGYPHLSVPPEAIWEKRRQLFDLRADDGARVGLWVAPGRDGSTCVWGSGGFGCSDPNQVEKVPTLALGFQGGRTHVNLGDRVGKGVAKVEARFEDGDTIELTPKEGYLIWPIPSRHYPLGHRLEKLVAFDAGGQVIARQNVSTTERGLYPCEKPKDYGYNTQMCP